MEQCAALHCCCTASRPPAAPHGTPLPAQPALQAEMVDAAYPPLYQSGGEYDLRLSALSNDALLHYGVIICSLGAK